MKDKIKAFFNSPWFVVLLFVATLFCAKVIHDRQNSENDGLVFSKVRIQMLPNERIFGTNE